MTDPHELIWAMTAGDGFHVVEWLPDPESDLHEARWVPAVDRPYLRWLMCSSLAFRHDLRMSAVPYRDAGSYLGQCDSSVLWVRTETGESVKRLARFKPRPTLILQEGGTNRLVAFWAIRRSLSPDDTERANRRLSYALHTAPKWCTPNFSFHPPGVILRHGRSKPLPVVVAEQTDELYAVGAITRNLKDRPKPDPSRFARKPVTA